MSEFWLGLAGSLALAGVHALTAPLHRIPQRHQASLASFSGGAGLAYVFLYLLFELASDGAAKIHAMAPLGPEPLETLFMILLGAVAANYLLQVHLQRSHNLRDDHRGFAGLFLTYNIVAGAGLMEEARWGALNLALYTVALGLHLLFNDRFLLHLYPQEHSWRWRAALAAAPVVGYLAASGLQPPEGLLYGLLAIIAGGTIVTAMRRELPDEQDFRATAFVVGVAGYAMLIMATWRF